MKHIPDVDEPKARRYAYTLLHRLPAHLSYHSIAHTCVDVLAATERLALLTNLTIEQRILLRTAVYFHDTGYIKQRHEHEAISADFAARILPTCGYTVTQITEIQGMITATRLPQSPHSNLEEVIADADLDSLGRPDFLLTSLALRAELATTGQHISIQNWYEHQRAFLEDHRYFTSAARLLRERGKQHNRLVLELLLSQI